MSIRGIKAVAKGLCAFFAISTVISACDRRPLEVYYPEAAIVKLNVDWLSEFKQTPSGMTVLFAKDGDAITQTTVTNSVNSTTVSLKPGTYKMLIFNQSKDEFGSIYFQNLTSYTDALALARNVTTRTTQKWDEGVTYMCDPERLGYATDEIVITEEMLEEQAVFVNYEHRNDSRKTVDSVLYVYNEVVYPLTTTLYVRARVRGIGNMLSVEGNIDGLANGCQLSQVWRTGETGTLLLSGWKTTLNSDNQSEGWITITVNTFGLPRGKEYLASRNAEDNVITLNFTLKDGTTKLFRFNVGKFIHYINNGEPGSELHPADVVLALELILDAPILDETDIIVLPDVEDKKIKGGGFDAEVAPWEDGGTIDIGL